ncbi:3-oxoacyl-[acyl-carrier-protein] reductase [Magnaporthiopsis poae ATCC 64411]|uniref:3-oxoacyl-[acyl-carrier-protein] reductase n=1 Tax=Magnaporthiopsis poae (strain ATCC 64411 / 73-15) TaxID=644358 RepID=A0A0C4DSK4_MAGP6|nr:3-oxoacyl-[acyl-carrier-protein] reductase [Magnaporthiopsis poae ATCC 64411]
MSGLLAGKLAVVTGSSRGIGAAIAENLAAKGSDVVLNYTSPSSETLAKELADSLASKHGVKTYVVQADLGTPTGPAEFVQRIKDQVGGGKPLQIDILVNNAGIALNDKLTDLTVEQFDKTYRVNVLGPLLLMQAVEPHLPRDRSGRVVNLSSVSSTCGFVGQSVYGGTKAALEAMTRTWARELSEALHRKRHHPGARHGANAGIKGWIEHTPLARPRPGIDSQELVDDAPSSGGRPAYTTEVAGIVGMLCTEDAAWCTGQVVCANGGMLMLH